MWHSLFFFSKFADFRPVTLLKGGSGVSVFLWILRFFSEHLIYKTPANV